MVDGVGAVQCPSGALVQYDVIDFVPARVSQSSVSTVERGHLIGADSPKGIDARRPHGGSAFLPTDPAAALRSGDEIEFGRNEEYRIWLRGVMCPLRNLAPLRRHRPRSQTLVVAGGTLGRWR